MNGFFTFTKHFKYLGCYISYNLRCYFDVEARIVYDTKAMGNLKSFWDNPHVDTYIKYLAFQDILNNLLLWRCEAWLLCTTLETNLGVLLQRHSRRILKISISQVKDDHIHWADIKEIFYNILSVENMIAARPLIFIGKVARDP